MKTSRALVSSVAVCLLSFMLLACDGGVATEGPVEPEPTPTDIPFPETTPFPADGVARLHEIRDAVAAIRGLPVNPEVEEGIITEDVLKAYQQQTFDALDSEDRKQLEVFEIVWRMMRLIEPEDDFEDLLINDSAEQVAGLYVPKEKRLVLLAEENNGGINEEFILAHEYTHSLQDAKYDLVALQENSEEDKETELSTTTSCVHEGDASLTAVYYLNEKYGDSWGDQIDDEPEDEDPELPLALERYMLFDYNECLVFVLTLQLLKGWDGVNGLLEEPPLSTEQILHPDLYIKKEEPIPVEVPDFAETLGSDWSLLEHGAYGEFDVLVYLTAAGLQDELAENAAEGWGGGHMQVFTAGEGDSQEVLLHIALVWDELDDWSEFWTAYSTAIEMFHYEESDTSTGTWRFNAPGEHGSAVWNQAERRVDILMSNDADVLAEAVDSVPQPVPAE